MRDFFKLKKIGTPPSRKQWGQLFKVLSKKERTGFFILFCLATASFLFLNLNFYFKNTMEMPAFGGKFREGVVGQPRLINPLYLSTQDADRDIVELLFSGIMKYNEEGKLVNDLAKTVEIGEQGKTFDVFLKENILWHDGEELTAQDVVFTVNLIQNPEYQSPLRIKWAGVTVEAIAENEVRFKLPKQYAGFLETLTLKIIPKHIFENIPPKNLPWTLVSQNYLIGSGPFKFKRLVQDKSGFIKKLILERNENSYSEKPLLNEISFIFFQEEKGLLKAADLGDIDGFTLNDPLSFGRNKRNNFKPYLLSLPRYFAVFFNSKKDGLLNDKKLKEALALAVDKEEIIREVFGNRGQAVNSPILPKFFGFSEPSAPLVFNKAGAETALETLGFKLNPQTQKREKTTAQEPTFSFKRNLASGSQNEDVKELQKCLAKFPEIYPEAEVSGYFGAKTKEAVIRFQEKYYKDILEPAGLKKGTGDVKSLTREKLNQICFERKTETAILQFTLTTCDTFPLVEIANVLKKNWKDAGIEIEIKKVSLADLQTNVLAKKDFEALLFGEALGAIPDPFPFWHSSQKDYPGLNVASYASKEADKLLEKAREAEKEEERKDNLEKFQEILTADLPAVFLARPDYPYFLSSNVKGYNVKKIIEPAKRFSTIEQWYIETKRVWR